jgi:ribonuclease-3
MEFLGDAVLGFLISARIYERFPDFNEGDLSKIKAYLVSAANLVHLADKIHLGDFLLLSRGEVKTGGRKKRAILADAYEAILGAIYLDGGVPAAAAFLDRQISALLNSLNLRQLTYGDFKSALQEQLHNMGRPEPVYRVADEIGPDHRKVFVVEIHIDAGVVARASGRSKKEAQQEAARAALEGLREKLFPAENGTAVPEGPDQ